MIDLPPDVPSMHMPMLVAEASDTRKMASRTNSVKVNYTIGVCHLAENPKNRAYTAVNSLDPALTVYSYLRKSEKENIDDASYPKARVTVLQEPTHGTLHYEGGSNYIYMPESSFFGSDRADFLVEIGRWTVKAYYHFNILKMVPGGTDGFDPYFDKRFCPKGPKWKISLNHIDNGHDLTLNKFAITSPWSRRGETARRFL